MPEFTEDQELLGVFKAETSEQLLSLALILRELMRNPASTARYAEELDRLLHTIKGSSAVVGMASLSALMAEVEKYVRGLRQQGQPLDAPALHLLLDLTLALSTYLEETFPAPFAAEEWMARLEALVTPTGALPSPADKETTPPGESELPLPAGAVDAETLPGAWVRPEILQPFLTTQGELTAVLEEMLTIYRQGTNALGDWEQLGVCLATATELNSTLRRQALRLPLVAVDWFISRVAAASGLPGVAAESPQPEAELSGETAAKLIPPLAALMKELGWTERSQPAGEAKKEAFLYTAEAGEEFLTLTLRRTTPSVACGSGEELMPREAPARIREAIGQVQGRLELDPAGNWFRLTVPVFPATVRCLLFQAGTEEYALPARYCLYQLTVKREEIRQSGDLTFIFRYPEVIPLVAAADFSLPLAGEDPDLTLILSEVERRHFALPVTRVEGYEDLLWTGPERPAVKGTLSFAKAYRPNGRPVLLADAGELAGLLPNF
ncbi:MAG TPA: Hpt domain-containing protein [Capillibacterium sp.]